MPKACESCPQSSKEVYVRCGGGEKLLDEVRQRIPAALQEEIDVANLSVLRSAVGRVAEALVAAQRGELVEIQGTADWVREEKGLSPGAQRFTSIDLISSYLKSNDIIDLLCIYIN